MLLRYLKHMITYYENQINEDKNNEDKNNEEQTSKENNNSSTSAPQPPIAS